MSDTNCDSRGDNRIDICNHRTYDRSGSTSGSTCNKNITRTQNGAGNQKLKIQIVIVEAIIKILRVMVIRTVGVGLGDRVSVIQTVLVVLMIVLLLIQINI